MNEDKVRRPNLFVVGVARAGTSSWHDYLKQHPEIFMSEEQRPNFFGEHKDTNAKYFNSEKKYLSLFEGVKNQKIIGESSHLFGSLNAPIQIKKFNPNSKIIIILRSPVDILRSALDAGGNVSAESLFFTLRELLYSDNLKRWIKTFGRNKVHIILFEDYVKDAAKEYKKVCEFLGIDNAFKPEFRKLNYSSVVNYPFFMKIIFYIWNKLPFFMRLRIKIKLGENRKRIQDQFRKIDNSKEIKTNIDKSDKEEIQRAFFLKEIEKTEKLLNRKLDIWKY
jgi:hypothetical protein